MGYSYGCVIVQRMALLFQDAGLDNVTLVLGDYEVTWPPSTSTTEVEMNRVGGYAWLGGDIEACLLMSRAMGGYEFAGKEANGLLSSSADERDAQALWDRSFKEVASKRGMSWDLYRENLGKASRAMEVMNFIGHEPVPDHTFDGRCLYLFAPDSPEFHRGVPIDRKFNTNMEVQKTVGSHYNCIHGQQAPASANVLLLFFQKLGLLDWHAPEGETRGLTLIKAGDGPSVYCVHGIDGDVFSNGASYFTLAPLLEPCQVLSLTCDNEALACQNMLNYTSLYNRRIVRDMQQVRVRNKKGASKSERIVIMGYSYGCVIVQRMALLFQDAGLDNVTLVLGDYEVTWPPSTSTTEVEMNRVGGYAWLGGDIEACLLMSRAMGGYEFAGKEANGLLSSSADERDAQALWDRSFKELASKRGIKWEVFKDLLGKASRAMDHMNVIGHDKLYPEMTFNGPCLYLLAPDSPEFHRAVEVDKPYCTNMEVRIGLGSHYNCIHGQQAPAAATVITIFLTKLGLLDSYSPPGSTHGLSILKTGEGPSIYFVHGMDGDLLSSGSIFSTLAATLEPCQSCALSYDRDALACNSIHTLAGLYNRRITRDMQQTHVRKKNGASKSDRIVIVGHSHGALIAHEMALLFSSFGKDKELVTLVLGDHEVTWPPSIATSDIEKNRTGGYPWLGGDIEACLFVARSMGGSEFAQKEAERLLALPLLQRDVGNLIERCFEETVSKSGMSWQTFQDLVLAVARNMEQLNAISSNYKPPAKYEADCLLIVAPGSTEFHGSQNVNQDHCDRLQTREVAGNHYDYMQGHNAIVTGKSILQFLSDTNFMKA